MIAVWVIVTVVMAFVEKGNGRTSHKIDLNYGPNEGSIVNGIYPEESDEHHKLEEQTYVNQNAHEDISTRHKRETKTELNRNRGNDRQDENNTKNPDEHSRSNQRYIVDVFSSSENRYNGNVSSWPLYAIIVRYRRYIDGYIDKLTEDINLDGMNNVPIRKKRQSNSGGMEFSYKDNQLKEHQRKNSSKSQSSSHQENLEEEYSKEHTIHDYDGKVQNVSKVKGGENAGGQPGNEPKKNETVPPKGEVVFPPTVFWCQCPQTKPDNDGRQVEPNGNGPVIVSGSLQKMFSFGIGGQLGIQFRKPKFN